MCAGARTLRLLTATLARLSPALRRPARNTTGGLHEQGNFRSGAARVLDPRDGLAIFAGLFQSVASTDNYLTRLRKIVKYDTDNPRFTNRAPKILSATIWIHNTILLLLSTGVIILFTGFHGSISYAPLVAYWTVLLLAIYLGSAFAMSHLAIRDHSRWLVLVVFAPAWLLFLGIFSSGNKSVIAVLGTCLAVLIASYIQYRCDRQNAPWYELMPSFRRLSPSQSTKILNVTCIGIAIWAFKSSSAAPILITGTWCLVLSFGTRSLLKDRSPIVRFGFAAFY